MRCLVEPPTSLDLWRFAAHLLRVTRNPPWEGPLRQAGFDDFRVGARLYDAEGHDSTPDITAVCPRSWLVIEITANGDSKKPKMEVYRRAEPQFLARDHGLTPPAGHPLPDALVIRKHEGVDDGAGQIVVSVSRVEARELVQIQDLILRDTLANLDPTLPAHLPSLSLAFVPESRPPEVRQGLVPAVMELLQKPTKRLSVHELVEEGLDFLAPKVSTENRKRLIEIVRLSMEDLIDPRNGWLANDLVSDAGYYRSAMPDSPHARSLGRIEEALRAWVDSSRKGRIKKLAEFPTDGPAGEPN